MGRVRGKGGLMLTPRQREIAELVARGYTAKRIARAANISPRTVEAHIRDAADRIPGDGRARWKLTLFVLGGADAVAVASEEGAE